ncbi:acylase [Phenylobacterium aquaticum]|uniref:acylase n=2 Tax=Phenylobacterium aquaticum TaxID=1763816 RepID=UPI0026F331AE|nr:acylase [Phenylobacterium aquaticum]
MTEPQAPEAAKPTGRFTLYLVRGIIVLMGLFVVVSVGMALLTRAGGPTQDQLHAMLAAADKYDVRIKRDTYGVPHIFGPRDADVAFGLGFAHSEDDFTTIQETALTSRGQLAAITGKHGAVTDYIARLLQVRETVDAGYDKLSADVRQVVEAYADGVNYYAALHTAQAAPGMLPLTGKDVVAGFVFKTPFFYGLDGTLAKLNAPVDGPNKKLPVGSNGIAIAPSRSADGATRLLVNSHQPYTGVVAWYEAVLDSGEGWHVAGGFFPGSPFMLHGHNAHLGWANTVNKPDLIDVYRLTLNPADPNQYRLDGQWKAFQVRDAALKVKVFGPITITVHKPVLRSDFGPVMKTARGAFAIRYAGMGEVRQVEQYYRLDKARDLAEWRAAMGLQALPSINYIYADEKGNIGYVYNAQFPNRKAGVDWSGVLPGDRSDLIWQGYLPFSQTPQIWNPKSGYVFNSNNTPFEATGAGDNLKPAAFPASMGIQTDMTNRALRVEETFGADPKITADTFAAYKFDVAYSKRSKVAALIAELVALDPQGYADFAHAQQILRAWDLKADVHSRGAALAILTAQPVLTAREKGKPTDPRAALTASIKTLKTHFKRIDPEWGEVNRIRRGHDVDLAIDGGPDTYRAVYGKPQENGTLTAVAGDTFIMFVTWDAHGQLSSQSIHQFGSATSVPDSPHYADQTKMFAAMKLKPVWFTADQLKGHIEEDYKPKDRAPKQ